jgi:hypothetical protein
MTLRRITLATIAIPLLSISAVAAGPSWTALVIVRDTTGPVAIDMPDKPTTEPLHVGVNPVDAKDKPFFTMDVTRGDVAAHIDRVIGVQTNAAVYMAAPVVVRFGSEDLCKMAADLLSKNADVISATCFQTN